MTRTTCWRILVCLTVLSCDEGDDGGPADPPSGIWQYDDQGINENTCGTEDVFSDPDTTFKLTNNGDGSFTVDQDAEEDFDCEVDGMDFVCAKRLFGEIEITQLNATLHYSSSIEGTFSSDTKCSGTQRMDIECEGAGCDLAGTLGYTMPCYYTYLFEAEAL